MGMFLNHRPFERINWFTVNAGIGIGYIENHIHIGDEVLPEGHSEVDADILLTILKILWVILDLQQGHLIRRTAIWIGLWLTSYWRSSYIWN